MANYTQHYQLHQWEPTDHFLRTDFNTDLEKIDAALGGMNGIVLGTYAGNDADSQTVDLGFQPKAVLVMENTGMTASNSGSRPAVYGGIALPDHPVETGKMKALSVSQTGFTAYRYPEFEYVRTNRSGMVYHYMAVR